MCRELFFVGFILLASYNVNGTDTSCKDYGLTDSACNGYADGNYEIRGYKNMFLQCIDGQAYCQPCWPANLVYVPRCNQCLYSANDECLTTQRWATMPTYPCPDLCPSKEYDFNGNMPDPSEERHFIACLDGMTVGCLTCPEGLKYNEKNNSCLYGGENYKQETIF